MSSKINNYLPIHDVLKEMGCEINSLPGYARCPRCNSNTLYVVQLTDGGGWYQCQGTCGLSGESIELLAAARSMTVADALRMRKMQDTEVFNSTNIRECLDDVRHREKIKDGWRHISDRANIFLLGTPALTELAAQLRIDAHVKADYWNDGLGRLFGLADNEQVQRFFGNGPIRPLPGAKDKAWLLTPIYQVPGRITGFVAFDTTNRTMAFSTGTGEPGLLFMHQPSSTKVSDVYAIGSPKHALALHVMAQNAHAAPPPLISYLPETDANSWQHVRGDRIVLWSPEITLDVFIAARQIGSRAYIARSPKLPDSADPYTQFRNASHSMIIENMRASAVPWLYALKDYIVQRGSSPEVDGIPEKLSLTPDELSTVQSICVNTDERSVIDSLYHTGPINITITLGNGHKIVQKPEGWFRVLRTKEQVLVSGAMPVIDTAVRLRDGEPMLLRGRARIWDPKTGKDVIVPFEVAEDKFKPAWLRSLCASAGHFTNVQDGLNIYEIATRVSPPRIAKGISSVGWDDAVSGFVFPHCRIIGGQFVEDESVFDGEHASGSLHSYPVNIAKDRVLEWLKMPAPFLAAYAMGLYNIIAPALGVSPVPVAVFNAGAAPLTALAGTFLYCPVLQDREKEEILAQARRHRMPVFVKATQKAYVSELLTLPNPNNMVVALNSEESAHLAKLLGWHMVAGSVDEIPMGIGMHELLPALLMHMQQDSIAPGKTPIDTALELLNGWLHRRFEIRSFNLQSVTKCVLTPDMSSLGVGTRLLGVIRLLVQAGELPVISVGMVEDALPHRSAAAMSSTELCVPVEGFSRALQRMGVDYPVNAGLIEALDATGKLLRVLDTLGRPTAWILSPSILEN